MKPAIAVTTLLLSLSLTACGGEDKPAVCNSSSDLKASIEDAKKIEVGSGTALADLKKAAKAIQSDLTAVQKDAKSEYSEQLDAIETAFAVLKTSIQTAAASASAATLATVASAVSAFGASVEALVSDVKKTC